MTKIYAVHELTALLKGTLETRFPFVWVRGQVSNLSRPGSGHVYFTLKDDQSCIDAVWFKQTQRPSEEFNPLTGEIFDDGPHPNLALTLQNGEDILCAGKISIYPPQGRMQLLVELAQPVGLGALQQEFERLKQELFTRGWFGLERKRALPENPERVAVITAPSGAVIHDFLRIAKNRGRGGQIRIYPSLVQGEGAPREICQALNCALSDGWAQIVVLIRGGGSLEDLWAFNSEVVAQALFASPIPVVTGIGHEPDISIADLVADVRAASPSHAAQLIWSERDTIAQQIDELELSLQHKMDVLLNSLDGQIRHFERAVQFMSPHSTLKRHEELLKNFSQRMYQAIKSAISRNEQSLSYATASLKPTFFYTDFSNKKIQMDSLCSHLEMLTTNRLAEFETTLPKENHIFSLLNQALIRYESRLPEQSVLDKLAASSIERAEAKLNLMNAKLDAASPTQPLNRGYALVTDEHGQVITSANQAQLGQHIEILLASSSLNAEITKINSKV